MSKHDVAPLNNVSRLCPVVQNDSVKLTKIENFQLD